MSKQLESSRSQKARKVPGRSPGTLSLPTGSPRTWWGVGRAKRNLLVLWLTVWRMEGQSQQAALLLPCPSGTPYPEAAVHFLPQGNPGATTHCLVYESQQVLLVGVQESD